MPATSPPQALRDIHHIGLLNFGGIGDEILFSPVIAALRQALPHAHLTLVLEGRSATVRPLLPPVDSLVEVQVLGRSRASLFWKLLWLLRNKQFDMVIASGSTPFIPILLALSGAPMRFGFETGRISRALLTAAAPLETQGYAAAMYFALAQTALGWLTQGRNTPPAAILPTVQPPSADDMAWARGRLRPDPADTRPVVLIHPGVSLASVAKGIVKSWAPDHWAALIQRLTPHYRVALTGGPDDRQSVAAIVAALPPQLPGFESLYGETRRLGQLAALMSVADVLACVDSAPMHMAVGLERPLVALFGPTSPSRLLPPGDARFMALCPPSTLTEGHGLAIAVESVAQAIDTQLARRPG